MKRVSLEGCSSEESAALRSDTKVSEFGENCLVLELVRSRVMQKENVLFESPGVKEALSEPWRKRGGGGRQANGRKKFRNSYSLESVFVGR